MVGMRKVKGNKAAFLKKLSDLRYLYIIGGIPLVIRKGRF
jgi:NADH dehydrogenase